MLPQLRQQLLAFPIAYQHRLLVGILDKLQAFRQGPEWQAAVLIDRGQRGDLLPIGIHGPVE